MAKSVEEAVESQLKSLATEARARIAWDTHGAFIVTRSLNQAADVANEIAAEHLELAIADPDALLPQIGRASCRERV